MSCLPKIPKKYIDQLHQMFEQFIWNGHRPKIPLYILQRAKNEGGAGLTDIGRRDDSLKAVWVKYIAEDMYPAKIAHGYIHPDLAEEIWSCNLAAKDIQQCCNSENPFWTDVLSAWCKYHYIEGNTENPVIWLNSDLRVNGHSFYWKTAAKAGLMRISDLVDEQGFIPEESAVSRYKLSILQYNTLKTVITKEMKEFCQAQGDVTRDSLYKELMSSNRAVNHIYTSICDDRGNPRIQQIEERWIEEILDEIDIIEEIKMIKYASRVVKHRSFQYRLIYRAVVMNIELKRWGIKDTENCSLCGQFPETYYHLFYACEHVKKLIEHVQGVYDSPDNDFQYRNIIFNSVNHCRYVAVNCVVLLLKQYVYRQRCVNKPVNVLEFKRLVAECKNSEKYYAKKEQKMRSFFRKWGADDDELRYQDQIDLII